MKIRDIYNIATSFRSAIMEAKYDQKFSYKDRMSNFPGGCCDDSCDLLAYYLYTVYKIRTKQCVGRYRDNNPDNENYNITQSERLWNDYQIILDYMKKQLKKSGKEL